MSLGNVGTCPCACPETKLPFSREEIKKILVVNLGGMGDFLLSLAAIKALSDYYKESELVLLTIPRTRVVAESYPYFTVVYGLDFKLFSALNTLLGLRKIKFDLVINMRTIVSCKSALKMALLLSIVGAKYTAGRNTSGRFFFLDIKVPEDDIGTLPEYQYDLDTMKALGIQAEFGLPEVPIPKGDSAYIDTFLNEQHIKQDDMIIGINPFAPWQAKCWPPVNFAEVINALKGEFNCKIVITGSSDEVNAALRLKDLAKTELAIASGKTTFGQLAALIKKCSVYITNDTGPMHLAAILQVPLVALFGGGYLKRFDPRNISDKAIVLHKNVDCSPCNKLNCNSMKCLKEITPQEVIDAVKSLLAP